MCVAIGLEKGHVRIDEDLCTGCGACTIACQNEALSLVSRTVVRGA
jgi:Fe-S-cluster-containing dehydrogenase component